MSDVLVGVGVGVGVLVEDVLEAADVVVVLVEGPLEDAADADDATADELDCAAEDVLDTVVDEVELCAAEEDWDAGSDVVVDWLA